MSPPDDRCPPSAREVARMTPSPEILRRRRRAAPDVLWFIAAGSDLAVAAAVLAEGLEWQYLVYPIVTMLSQLALGILALGRREPGASAVEDPAVPGAFS